MGDEKLTKNGLRRRDAYLGVSGSWTRPLWNGARGCRIGRDFRAGHSEPTEKSRPTGSRRQPDWKPRQLRSCAGACPSAFGDVPDGCWTILARELPSVLSWNKTIAKRGYSHYSILLLCTRATARTHILIIQCDIIEHLKSRLFSKTFEVRYTHRDAITRTFTLFALTIFSMSVCTLPIRRSLDG